MNRKELVNQIFNKKSFLCVGLDTDVRKLPEHLREEDDAIFKFNKAIIDATAPYCVAYKPNLAFYESMGVSGMVAFEKTVVYLKDNYPHHFVIADAKRGDIGNTSIMYARTFFEEYNVDALTVAPYMGEDSVKPFLGYPGKWVILLALTSNKGSHDFQLTTDTEGERLFEKVIRTSQQWGNEEDMMYVVGATQGAMFADIRKVAPRHFLLVPGGRAGWKPAGGLQVWHDGRLWPAGQFVPRHHLCLQWYGFRRGGSTEGKGIAGADGPGIGENQRGRVVCQGVAFGPRAYLAPALARRG